MVRPSLGEIKPKSASVQWREQGQSLPPTSLATTRSWSRSEKGSSKSMLKRLGLDKSPTTKLKSSKHKQATSTQRKHHHTCDTPWCGLVEAKEPKTSDTGQAWAPSGPILLPPKFMSRTELLVFKASARAWKKHKTSKIRVSNCNK